MPRHFLENFQVHNKPEAGRAAERAARAENDPEITRDRSKKIEAYIDRLENIFLNPDTRVRERNIEMMKPKIYSNTIIKSENFPESYFDYQKKLMKERGFGTEIEINGQDKQTEIAKVQESQKQSLDAWIDYLTGDDCKYPADIKYFAMMGVLKLGNFDTETYAYTGRKLDTTASFAEIDREALSKVLGAMEAKQYGKPIDGYSEELLKLIDQGKSFGDLYSLTMKELDSKAEKQDLLPITEGEWLVFKHGTNPNKLVEALEGKRSNICIADIGAATRYLDRGSIEIYFSFNRAQKPTVPRIAIAYDDNGVYEVRGTYNKSEDIDPYIEQTTILMDRLQQLPKGENFAKKDGDMKQLTKLYNKCFKEDKKTGVKEYLSPNLTKTDLIFLYEINASIDGFGYQKDPRIKELLNERNILADAETIYECDFNNPGKKELELIYGVGDKSTPPAFFETMKRLRQGRNIESDMLLIFECQPNQIIRSQQELQQAIKEKKEIKAYIGELFPNFFKVIPQHIEHIYTEFPEGKIKQKTIELGTGLKTKAEFVNAIEQQGSGVGDFAKDIMSKAEFVVSNKEAKEDLIILTVKALGFPSGATVKEIFERAKSLGLELCPPETGPQLRLQYPEQPIGEWCRIGMEPITGSDGDPDLFRVDRDDDEPWLDTSNGRPGNRYGSGNHFAFVRASNS